MICTSCGVLVGVNDDTCYNCGRRNPGLWGFAPALRSLGGDLGFVPFVIGACVVLYVLTLVASQGNIGMGGLFGMCRRHRGRCSCSARAGRCRSSTPAAGGRC